MGFEEKIKILVKLLAIIKVEHAKCLKEYEEKYKRKSTIDIRQLVFNGFYNY